MKSGKARTRLPYLVVGVLIAVGLYYALDLGHGERRLLLYSIARELAVGMPRSQVETVLSRHQAPFLNRSDTPDGIVLRVSLGAAEFGLLSIQFQQGLLSSARIRGEDGPEDRLEDAPPDIP